MITRSEPIFAVSDLTASIAFYRDVLGGEGEWMYGDPPGFGGIRLYGAQLLFCLQPEMAGKVEGLGHFLFVEDIKSMHEQHVSAGAPILDKLENKPWGLSEYTVRDLNGYHLRFTGPLLHEKPAHALDHLPGHVTIEHRFPTAEQYTSLATSVGWSTTANKSSDCLSRSVAGCVAIDTRCGDTIGMARAVHDAHGWYSIWDVVVHPDHQNQRIGTALMEQLVHDLRQTAPPGSHVYLFTFSHGFYERLGFKSQPCTLMKL